MLGQPRQDDARHDLDRAGRPAPLDIDPLQALQEAAEVDQQARPVAPDRVKGYAHPLPRVDHVVDRAGRVARTAPVDPGGAEIRSHPRQQRGGGHVPPQPFPVLEGCRVERQRAVPVAPAHHPGLGILRGVAQGRAICVAVHDGEVVMLRRKRRGARHRLPAQARPPGGGDRQLSAGVVSRRQVGSGEAAAGRGGEATAVHRDPVAAPPDQENLLREGIGPRVGAGLAQARQQAGRLRGSPPARWAVARDA